MEASHCKRDFPAQVQQKRGGHAGEWVSARALARRFTRLFPASVPNQRLCQDSPAKNTQVGLDWVIGTVPTIGLFGVRIRIDPPSPGMQEAL